MNLKRILALIALAILPAASFAQFDDDKKEVTASLVANVNEVEPGKKFTLAIKLDVPAGYYTYYKTAGGMSISTTASFAGPAGFKIGPALFPAPTVKHISDSEINYVYKHDTAILCDVEVPANVTEKAIEFTAEVSYQFCLEGGTCWPPKPKSMSLKLPVGSATPSASNDMIAKLRKDIPKGSSEFVKLSASFSKPTLKVGETGELVVKVTPSQGVTIPATNHGAKELLSTDLLIDKFDGIDFPTLPKFPEAADLKVLPQKITALKGYGGEFTIRAEVKGEEELKGKEFTLGGMILCQPILANGDRAEPQYVEFAIKVPIGSAGTTAANPTTPNNDSTTGSKTAATGSSPDTTSTPAGTKSHSVGINGIDPDHILANLKFDSDSTSQTEGIGLYLFYAFVGGLLLNFMPCVLPVIAIKILSFAQQAGEDRKRVWMLNFCYSLGVITVFLVLAVLSVNLKMNWGGLFQIPEFIIVMAIVVFAMALSLLGVYEIPVPGFVGSASAAHREGLGGAYLIGIFATLLATPCSGPFLGVTFVWSVGQPPIITYIVWATMGLGMAFPYLVIGIYPPLISWLPKPGLWMVRFKELAGLFLLGTTVYIVWLLDGTLVKPCIVMLLGIGVALWMVGNLYDFNSSRAVRWFWRVTALAVAGSISFFGLTFVKDLAVESQSNLTDAAIYDFLKENNLIANLPRRKPKSDRELPWEMFTETKLKALIAEGKTVMIDFTADWCMTCRYVERTALNTLETRELVEKLGITTLYADITRTTAEGNKFLPIFRSKSIPMLVIFSPKNPQRPVVFRDIYTKSALLEQLRQAGPSTSVSKEQRSASAMR